MINLLGQSEYGLYSLVASVVSYLSLLSFGMTSSYLRFYSRYKVTNDHKGEASLNGMFLVVFICMSLIAIVVGFVLSLFPVQIFGNKLTAEELEKSQILMRILVVNIALTFPSSIFDSIVSAHEQFVFQKLLKIATVVFNPFICLPLLMMGYDSVAIVIVTTFLTIIHLCVNVWFCIKKLNTKFMLRNFNFGLLREIAIFSSFIFINILVNQINWSVDKLILGRTLGTNEVAVYGVSADINSLFISLSSTISAVFAPRINKISAENNFDKNEKYTTLFIRVGRIQYLLLMLVASGFVIFGKYFITKIYLSDTYEMSYYAAMLLILPAMIPSIQNLGIEIQRAENKHKFRSIAYLIMAILNIIISIPMAMRYGCVGTSAGTAISIILANGILMNIYYYKTMKINIVLFWKNILKLSKGMIIPILCGVFIMNRIVIDSTIDFCIWVVIYTAVYIVSQYLFGMNEDEKSFICKIKR